ncbi:MAG TPA: DNA-directed RNA polymerase subunit beta [Anaerolineales bacterium]|nr:DNA-directed RNA polymerase subunit beta [Anaerolineales bacterium]
MASASPSKSYARIDVTLPLPDLIEVQIESFKRLKEEGLSDLFHEISPIESYNKGMKLYFPSRTPEAEQWGLTYWFDEPKHTIEDCVERDLTYASPLYVSVLLAGPDVPEPIKQDIFLGDFPEMSEKGTFIINGTERVVVSQLIRSPGVYFEAPIDRSTGRPLAIAKLIPDRGAWMEFETRKSDYLTLRFNRKRTIPVTIFLRALAAVDDGLSESPLKEGTDEEILDLFADVDNNPDRMFIASTIAQEPEWDLSTGLTVAEAALLEFFRRMRPGDPATIENAREFLEEQLFDQRHYDLERVGRYKLNQKLELHQYVQISHRTITKWDILRLVRRMIAINNGTQAPDDIDHLGNRRAKTVGELIQNKLRIGLRRMERVIKERMSIRDQDQLSPVTLVNIRPVVAALREFFGSSQLSQFMDQTNPLAELRHKRTLSALGPGGLRRERAGFDVRDVHHSHYGRICPIETPEGPNIGLIGRLASFSRVNEYGFIETPYRRVRKTLAPGDPRLVNRALREDLVNPGSGKIIAKKDDRLTEKTVKSLDGLEIKEVLVVPFVSDEVEYLSADVEDKFVIAQANTPLNEYGEFVRNRVSTRYHSGFVFTNPESIDYMDVAPHQIVGISAALIPFLEHNDANRALMGSNMQAQAVPLVKPDVPQVSTGMEYYAALDSGQVVVAEEDGEVISVTGSRVVVRNSNGEHGYPLRKYQRSNQSTCIDQRPAVVKGQRIHKGDVIADSSSTVDGELALGQNVTVAFLSWEGANFEDAIVISERLVQEDLYTSVHIEKYELESRDTRLGPEEITRDIPNVGEDAIKDLDEQGIIRIGAEVGPNDILVGKISPKGEKELTPEERLLRAIFGEKSRDVKDTSLRMPHGERGKVVDVKVFTREDNSDLSAGVDMMVRVSVAQRRKITAGDKMAGRHGNKGVVSRVVPVEDMPLLEDGTPVDIILNPTGIPGRMNLGQVLETHLGWAANRLGFRAISPVFDGATEAEIEAELARAWMIDTAWEKTSEQAWQWIRQFEYDPENIRDDDEVRNLFLEAWLGERDYDVYRLVSDPLFARRSVLREWLRDNGYDPQGILAFEDVELPESEQESQDQRAVNACLRLWMQDLEVDLDGVNDEELWEKAEAAMIKSGRPIPVLGKQVLRDGKTGEPYDRPVTVGIMSVMKLHHLVEDKVHARSTGPYSLVSQQPLGGKAQFGGQRFGEMEVWALEAYGAAYTLQEMLTVKSDDVQGRVKTYEAIVKGEPIEEPSIPASFRVLVKELQSLGLAVEAVTDTGEIIRFGKDEERARPPKISTGLLGLGDNF